MNKEIAYRKTLRRTNKDQIRNLGIGLYLDAVKYRWFKIISANTCMYGS
jgi:hypothetical protein